MNTGFQLFQLQQIDSSIAGARRRIAEIKNLIADQSEHDRFQNLLSSLEQDPATKESEYNHLSFEIQSKKNKKSQSESMLYAGKIQNPKELQDLQMEITSLNQAIQHLEDDLLEKLISLEEAQETLEKAREQFAKTTSEWEIQKSRLQGEMAELERAIINYQSKRQPVISQLTENDLGIYKSLLKAKNGVAVGKLQDDACSCCGTSLTASQRQQARSASALFFCPSCGRIIYGS